jgi:hypothetical protein
MRSLAKANDSKLNVSLPSTRNNVVHLNVVKESRVMSDPNKKEAIPEHVLSIMRTVLSAVLIALVCWAGVTLIQSGSRLDVINANLATIQANQQQVLQEQKATHDSVLIMSATYATKEDLEKQRQIFSDQVKTIDSRLREIEHHNSR